MWLLRAEGCVAMMKDNIEMFSFNRDGSWMAMYGRLNR